MIALILGVPNSGKSRRAEALTLELAGAGRRVYLATMVPVDAAGRERIRRHRTMREGKGFETIERPVDMAGLAVAHDFSDAVCLLECMANLVGNESRASANAGITDAELTRRIVDSVRTLASSSKALVVVSNAFPLDAPGYDAETRRYVAAVEATNVALRGIATRVEEYREGGWVVDDAD